MQDKIPQPLNGNPIPLLTTSVGRHDNTYYQNVILICFGNDVKIKQYIREAINAQKNKSEREEELVNPPNKEKN